MPLVAVKLTDAEWRVKCEQLAEEELRRKKRREQLEEEEGEWRERKKDLQGRIDKLTDKIENLAQEVSDRETMRDAQTELPLQPTETTETTEPINEPDDPAPPSEEPPAEREPGNEG